MIQPRLPLQAPVLMFSPCTLPSARAKPQPSPTCAVLFCIPVPLLKLLFPPPLDEYFSLMFSSETTSVKIFLIPQSFQVKVTTFHFVAPLY